MFKAYLLKIINLNGKPKKIKQQLNYSISEKNCPVENFFFNVQQFYLRRILHEKI